MTNESREIETPGDAPAEPLNEHQESSRLRSAAIFLLYLIPIFATLAYGAVETWAFGFISLLTGLLVLFWIADSLFKREFRIDTNLLQVPFAALVAVGLIQLLPLRAANAPSLSIPAVSSLSANPYATRVAVIQLIAQLVFFAAAFVFFDNSRRIKRLSIGFVIFASLLAFFGILQWLANPQGIYGWRPTPQAIPFGTFVNQHHFAALMEMSIGLTLGLLFGGALKKDKRLLLVIGAVLMASAVALTGSRGGLLSMLIVAIIAAFLGYVRRPDAEESEAPSRIPRKVALVGFGVGFAVLLVAMVVFLGGDASLMRGVGITNQADFSSGRLHFWSVAMQIFKDHPILGAGLDGFATVFPNYDSWNGTFRVEQAHNDYLQILADAGIAGFACVATFVFLLFRKSLAMINGAADPHRRSIAVGALAGCAGMLVHSFFDFPLRTPANAYFFLLLVVLATTAVRFPRRHRSRHR
ncbi:MAG: O-antigen ligase family protein [Acidobacteria bacterium]|nr:O-antigen ligase family protein [Acidobacteriota bacterium]